MTGLQRIFTHSFESFWTVVVDKNVLVAMKMNETTLTIKTREGTANRVVTLLA